MKGFECWTYYGFLFSDQKHIQYVCSDQKAVVQDGSNWNE